MEKKLFINTTFDDKLKYFERDTLILINAFCVIVLVFTFVIFGIRSSFFLLLYLSQFLLKNFKQLNFSVAIQDGKLLASQGFTARHFPHIKRYPVADVFRLEVDKTAYVYAKDSAMQTGDEGFYIRVGRYSMDDVIAFFKKHCPNVEIVDLRTDRN